MPCHRVIKVPKSWGITWQCHASFDIIGPRLLCCVQSTCYAFCTRSCGHQLEKSHTLKQMPVSSWMIDPPGSIRLYQLSLHISVRPHKGLSQPISRLRSKDSVRTPVRPSRASFLPNWSAPMRFTGRHPLEPHQDVTMDVERCSATGKHVMSY